VAGRLTSSRFLLLLLLLVGVAGMHTVGHPVGHDQVGPAHGLMSTASLVESSSVQNSHVDTALAERATHDGAGEHDPHPVTNPLEICLAVLVAAVLLWLAAALCRLPGSAGEPRTAGYPAQRGRDPPASILVGLRIADLSVRRT
jgi:hypothetical protein